MIAMIASGDIKPNNIESQKRKTLERTQNAIDI
jgi:hypothetical protein